MRKLNKFLLMLLLMLSFTLVGCTDPEDPDDDSGDPDDDPSGEVLTVGPYVVHNEDGSVFGTYDSMFTAIRIAGEISSSSNKSYVEDANKLMIFKRQSKNDCWCYNGLKFAGVKPKNEAIEWSKANKNSYVVDGQGKGYIILGTDWYPNTNTDQDIPLELFSGGYNYLFSKSGIIESDVWVKQGYGYCEFVVDLTEATYMPTQEPYYDYEGQPTQNQWNAYIFVNGAAGYTSDLGLIGVIREGRLVWALVRNCSHPDHKALGDSFQVLDWTPVTTMEFDAKANAYTNGDRLLFQCYQGIDGWTLHITNLATNKVYTIEEKHEGMFEGNTQYFRFLLAASYCPVTPNIWNARSGGYLRNVVFENPIIARWNEEEIYDESMYESLYPGSDTMIYGFSQAGDCASMEYNVDEQGNKLISFSCYYDGGGH